MKNFYQRPGIRSIHKIRQGEHSFMCSIFVAIKWAEIEEMMTRYGMTHERDYGKITVLSDRERMKLMVWQYDKILKEENYQLTRARNLIGLMGFSRDIGYGDVRRLQEIVRLKYKLFVFRLFKRYSRAELIFQGDSKSLKSIFILTDHDMRNFGVAKTISGVMNNRFLCQFCGGVSNSRYQHQCKDVCNLCGRQKTSLCEGEPPFSCLACHRVFYSQSCWDAHDKRTPRGGSRCSALRACINCSVLYRTCNPHFCDRPIHCNICTKKVARGGHQCTWPEITSEVKQKFKSQSENFRGAVFDLEVIQNTLTADGRIVFLDEHVVNLAVLLKVCSNCNDKPLTDECSFCSPRQVVFEGFDAMKAFVTYLKKDPTMNHRTVISHGGGIFDFHFILNTALKEDYGFSFVNKGRKVITMRTKGKQCNELVFKDSNLLLPFSLANLARMFGLEVAKGHFPFYSNTEELQGEVLPRIPEKKLFGYERMTLDAQKRFDVWYEEELTSGREWDLTAKLKEYCINDCVVLLAIVQRYRSEFMQISRGYCPFTVSNTLSSLALFLIKHEFTDVTKIGHISERGFQGTRQSDLALRFIKYEEHRLGIPLQYARSSAGEKKVYIEGHTFSLDCYSEEHGVLEVNGCWFHSHLKCFSPDSKINGTTAKENNARTMERIRLLETRYPVRVVWECEIEEMRRLDPVMDEFMKNVTVVTRLIGRSSLQGGRVDTFKTYAKRAPGREIIQIDCVSIYPSVFANCPMPLYNPKPILEFSEEDLVTLPFRGLIKCCILPTRSSKLPVLGVTIRGGLYYGNCFTCIKESNQNECDHENIFERALTGTWTTEEVRLALSKGYRILECYEVWHWDEWDSNLYTEYVKTFLRGKITSGGFPPHVVTEEDKLTYCREVSADVHPAITVDEVELNPAKRLLNKLMLNVSWGKLATRCDLSKVEFLDSDELARLEMDTSKEITFAEIAGKRFHVHSRPRQESIGVERDRAVHHAAYTTSYARIKMNSILTLALEHPSVELMYTDTDCLIACIDPNDNPFTHLLTGKFGEFSSEIPSKYFVDEAVICGPKSYSLKLVDRETGEVSYKNALRGIIMTAQAEKSVDHDRMKDMVFNRQREDRVTLNEVNIRKTRIGHLWTVEQTKMFRIVNNKKRIVGSREDESYLPFGYKPDTV